MDLLDSAISYAIPVIIKAESVEGRRIVRVEASNEAVDAEGDVILQEALLNSAKSFVEEGHLDIDHYSEIGHRLGISNPEWYIVGHPMSVEDAGGGRTFVKGELRKAADGSFDPRRPYDMLWEQLTSDPPVKWLASIFGYPISSKTEDCRDKACGDSGATRYLIKGLRWTSLAFTRRPVNQALKGYAKIVSAKALIKSHIDAGDFWYAGKGPDMAGTSVGGERTPNPDLYPRELDAEFSSPANTSPQGVPVQDSMPGGPISLSNAHMGHVVDCFKCAKCGPILDNMPSLAAFRNHFGKCAGLPPGLSDIAAHAAFAKRLMGYY